VPTFVVSDKNGQRRMVGIGRGIKDLIKFLKQNE